MCGPKTVSNPEEIVIQNKSKDWSTKNYHGKSERSKDTSTMLMTTSTKFVHQNCLNVENVSNIKLNHSSDAKASETSYVSISSPNIIYRHRTEPKQLLQTNLQQQQQHQKLKSIEIGRTFMSSCKGNDENVTESLQKSIINHLNLDNVSSSKLNEGSKSKKKPLYERRHKRKSEAKHVHEKKKITNNGKQIPSSNIKCPQQESSQRILIRLNKSETVGSISLRNTDKQAEKEWHSPESYLYDDICSDAMTDCSELSPCMQTFWFRDIFSEDLLTREQRLENKRDNLRRQAFQYAQAQHFRSTILAKKRLITVTKALSKFKSDRNK